MVRVLIALIVLLAPNLVNAQFEGHSMNFGIGYGHETVKDNSLSPVSYSGHFAMVGLGYKYQGNKLLSILNISGFGGLQYPDVGDEQTSRYTISGLSRLKYSMQYKIYSTHEWDFYAGIMSHNMFDYRNHSRYGNSQSNYLAYFSFGPVIGLQKPFEVFERKWMFQYNLGLPFGTYTLRPGYIKPFFNTGVGAKQWAWWGDFYVIDSGMDLSYLLENGNQLRLSYNWEYSQFNKLNRVQTGLHTISFSTIFKF